MLSDGRQQFGVREPGQKIEVPNITRYPYEEWGMRGACCVCPPCALCPGFLKVRRGMAVPRRAGSVGGPLPCTPVANLHSLHAALLHPIAVLLTLSSAFSGRSARSSAHASSR